MRKRNLQVMVRLDQGEYQKLKRLVSQAGLSQAAYLRHLINGVVPKEAPPPDYFAMMKELRAIGNNINQIAYKAHTFGVLDTVQYEKQLRDFQATIKTITRAVLLPEQRK